MTDAPLIDVLVPFEQEGTRAVVRSWLKRIGERVAKDDPLVELETDKVTQEVSAPADGVLAEILLDSDAEALPGALLGRIGAAAGAGAAVGPVAANGAEQARAFDPAAPAIAAETRLSPAVRRAVRQHAIDPATIDGSGRGGRITRADVDRAIAARGGVTETPAPAPSAGGVRVVPHDTMRLAIARNMLDSVTVAPHVTAVFEADFSAIMAHRRKHKEAFAKEGVNLTFTAYFVAACVAAMRAVPAVNSRWHADRLEILDDINIGVGTALGDKGLIVPVIRQAQILSLLGIATRLDDLTARARAGKLVAADVRGGTFTISNHGVSGSLMAAPIIIAQPQSAILGIGKLEKRVVVREVDGVDAIQIRPLAYVSLTIDHRSLDGHQTNTWLSKFVETIEKWPL